jgi:hypothetical protein
VHTGQQSRAEGVAGSTTRVIGLSLAAAAMLILPWAVPGKSGAATVLGQVSPANPPELVTGNYLQSQTATLPYTVPFPGGVITGWSHRGRSGNAGSGRLQLWGAVTTSSWFLVARSELESFTPGAATLFPTRLTVHGGEALGLHGENAGLDYVSTSGSDLRTLMSGGGDPAPGETRVNGGSASFRLVNVSAVLEPDADADGFGDETQDQCLGQAGSASGCTPAAAGPTGQRARARKRCKKKPKGPKRRKCNKKAKKLPV